MAMIDYGALLRVDKVLQNEGKMFMQSSDTGYMLKTAISKDKELIIQDNYFVYAGDEDLLLCFYKMMFYVISNGQVIHTYWNSTNSFDWEEIVLPNGIKVEVNRLTKRSLSFDYYADVLEWIDFNKDFLNKRLFNKWKKCFAKRAYRNRVNEKPDKVQRFKAAWTHKGKKYEVIFGYGVDWNKEFYESGGAADSYGLFPEEISLIKSWFN